MKVRILPQAVAAATCLGLGLLGAAWIVRSAPEPAEIELPAPVPVAVTTHRIRARAVPRTVASVGTLGPWREAVLASEIGGRTVAIGPEGVLVDGEMLARGSRIVQLDATGLDAELAAQDRAIELSTVRIESSATEVARAKESAELARESAALRRDDETRWEALVGRGQAEAARLDVAKATRVAAELTLSEALARMEAAEAQGRAAAVELRLAEARRRVSSDRRSKAVVTAPFDGRYVAPARIPTLGSVVGPLEPLGSIVDVTRMRLRGAVHEDDLDALRVGNPVTVAPGSRPGLVLSG